MILQEEDDFDEEPDCTMIPDDSDLYDGKIRALLHVPDRYLGHVCGQHHSRRKEIEATTATSIIIPEKGSNEDIGKRRS